MDKLNYRILEVLQNEFPLCGRPYEVVSKKLKISCEQLIVRIESLIADGVIRRIGASFDSRKFCYYSKLAAICVEESVVEQASEIIEGFAEITHSYLRSDQFNIWFTIIASNNERIEHIIEEIQLALSIESSQVLNLPIKRLFKLNACFNILF